MGCAPRVRQSRADEQRHRVGRRSRERRCRARPAPRASARPRDRLRARRRDLSGDHASSTTSRAVRHHRCSHRDGQSPRRTRRFRRSRTTLTRVARHGHRGPPHRVGCSACGSDPRKDPRRPTRPPRRTRAAGPPRAPHSRAPAESPSRHHRRRHSHQQRALRGARLRKSPPRPSHLQRLATTGDGTISERFFVDVLRRAFSEQDARHQLELAIDWGRTANSSKTTAAQVSSFETTPSAKATGQERTDADPRDRRGTTDIQRGEESTNSLRSWFKCRSDNVRIIGGVTVREGRWAREKRSSKI